ncbi:MAG: rhomboid family intramembrane serine protease [Candidatus Hodarchaeota archaeon]
MMKENYKRIITFENLPSSFATSSLCFILVLVYVLMMIFFPYKLLEQSPIAFQLMGMSDSVFQGEIYRFLSSIWFHGNVVHLASNLLFLFIFSIRLEELTRSRTVFIVFICSGIIGNIGTILWVLSGIPIISVGASGAIFGLLGALIYLLKGKSKREQRKMVYFLIIFFTITISQDTNFFSHLFGMIGGIAITVILKYISDHKNLQFV